MVYSELLLLVLMLQLVHVLLPLQYQLLQQQVQILSPIGGKSHNIFQRQVVFVEHCKRCWPAGQMLMLAEQVLMITPNSGHQHNQSFPRNAVMLHSMLAVR